MRHAHIFSGLDVRVEGRRNDLFLYLPGEPFHSSELTHFHIIMDGYYIDEFHLTIRTSISATKHLKCEVPDDEKNSRSIACNRLIDGFREYINTRGVRAQHRLLSDEDLDTYRDNLHKLIHRCISVISKWNPCVTQYGPPSQRRRLIS